MTALEVKNDVLQMIVNTNDKAALEQIRGLLEELPDNNNGVSKPQEDFAKQLIQCIREQHFEYGVTSDADKLISKQMAINTLAIKSILNDLFIKNYDKPDILVGLLQVISRLSVEQINPEGYNMVNVAISHENIEVKETAIRCLENWSDNKSLKILQSISVNEAWLQDYINTVVNDIQEELCLT